MQNIMKLAAGLMELSARTAPKSAGQDFIRTKVISGEGLSVLAAAMESYIKEKVMLILTGQQKHSLFFCFIRNSITKILQSLICGKHIAGFANIRYQQGRFYLA